MSELSLAKENGVFLKIFLIKKIITLSLILYYIEKLIYFKG